VRDRPAVRGAFPPSPSNPNASRGPHQLDGMLDADGNTVLFFTSAISAR
jgi:hypothetical protein